MKLLPDIEFKNVDLMHTTLLLNRFQDHVVDRLLRIFLFTSLIEVASRALLHCAVMQFLVLVLTPGDRIVLFIL